MTGERWEWYRVASHLKIPVIELRERITYTEFLDWFIFLQKRETEREMIQDHYLAQIAAEVCRSRVTEPKKIETKHFYVKVDSSSIPTPHMPTEAEKEKSRESKKAWAAGLNLTIKK